MAPARGRRWRIMPRGAAAWWILGAWRFLRVFSVMDRLLFGTRSIGRALSGLRPEPHEEAHWSALRGPILDLRQGQRPLEPVNGFVLSGGPTRTSIGRGWPSPE